jgi:hypothetical protein
VPPATDQLGGGVGLVHQLAGCVELPRIRICSSVGSVTVAVLLVTVICSFLPLEVFQHDIQLFEPIGPQTLAVGDPVVNRLERGAVQPVQPLSPLVAYVYDANLAQHP